jgi:hypothetical protein
MICWKMSIGMIGDSYLPTFANLLVELTRSIARLLAAVSIN